MSTFRFKPNKKMASDGIEGAFTNGERSNRAEKALLAYRALVGDSVNDDECAIGDLIADLGHYCDRSKDADFEGVIASAVMHWKMER